MAESNQPPEGEIIFYTTPEGVTKVEVVFQEETFWLTINRMAELFSTSKQDISYHLQQIYESGELIREATVKEILTVQSEGSRNVSRKLDYYNLDAIIAVGYRVNSLKATQFRIWATQTLREFIIKGFVLVGQSHLMSDKRGCQNLLSYLRFTCFFRTYWRLFRFRREIASQSGKTPDCSQRQDKFVFAKATFFRLKQSLFFLSLKLPPQKRTGGNDLLPLSIEH